MASSTAANDSAAGAASTQKGSGKASTLTTPLLSGTTTPSGGGKHIAMSSTNPAPSSLSDHHKATATTKSKKRQGLKQAANVLYDPNKYSAACNPEFVKSHALLDLTSPAITEREEKLIELALLSCEARGKMAHLTALRDALDGLLIRQLACLMTVLHHNQPIPLLATSAAARMLMDATHQPAEALIEQHLLVPKSATIDFDDILENHGPPAHFLTPTIAEEGSSISDTAAMVQQQQQQQHLHQPKKKLTIAQFKKMPLRLSAAHKIVQLDCAQKEQDIHLLRDRIVLLLQRPSLDSPPTTAPGGRGGGGAAATAAEHAALATLTAGDDLAAMGNA